MPARTRAPIGAPVASDDAPASPPDLRLLPAALSTWAVVLLGLYTGPVGGAAATGLAGCALLAALRSRRSAAAVTVVVAAAGCALAAGVVITTHTLASRDHPARAAAARGAAATLTVVVRDDPLSLIHI